jgi:hypothetical protein
MIFLSRCDSSYVGFSIFNTISSFPILICRPWVRHIKIGKEEIDMTFKFKFSKINEPYLNIKANDLENARLDVSNAGFELQEIWHAENAHSHETWKDAASLDYVRFNVIPQNNIVPEDVDDETCPPEDASRQDVIDELLSVWLELHEIRNHLTAVPDEDYFYKSQKEFTPLDRFWQKVSETKELKEADPEEWHFIVNDYVDETVFAFYELSYDDRLAIVH